MNMAAITIQFFNGIDEKVVPKIRLTKSKYGHCFALYVRSVSYGRARKLRERAFIICFPRRLFPFDAITIRPSANQPGTRQTSRQPISRSATYCLTTYCLIHTPWGIHRETKNISRLWFLDAFIRLACEIFSCQHPLYLTSSLPRKKSKRRQRLLLQLRGRRNAVMSKIKTHPLYGWMIWNRDSKSRCKKIFQTT